MLAMRLSSKRMVRIHWARGGASTSIRRSAARMNGTSLAKLPNQSMRLIKVVDLRIGPHLGQLLVAPVHVAHDRIGRHDLLAVELGDDAQRAVGGRMLGADVEGHALGLDLQIDAGVGGLRGDVAELLTLGDGHGAPP